MVVARVAEGMGVAAGGIAVAFGPDVAFGGLGVAVGRNVAVAGMAVIVGSSPDAFPGDRLLDLVSVLADVKHASSLFSCPTRRQNWPAPSWLSDHVTLNRDLANPSEEMNKARMHATEDATIRRSLHPAVISRREPVLIPDLPRPHSCPW
jgi:hypothetical protein